MKRCVHILLIAIFLLSCREDKKEAFTKVVKEWQGKEVVFPEGLVFSSFAEDTVDFNIPSSTYKVIIFVDSAGCTNCKLQLSKWKELIAYTDSVSGGTIPFLFFFQSKDDRELRYLLKRDNFAQPICIDHQNIFNKTNAFPADLTFQTFLLDKDNRVAVIGNPVHNATVRQLYLKQIGDVNLKKAKGITTLSCSDTETDIGTIDNGDTVKKLFRVRNTGKATFVLKGITTSCDCTTATASWSELLPGESAEIAVVYEAEKPGDFIRTVSIFGNTPDDEPLNINIIGTVV